MSTNKDQIPFSFLNELSAGSLAYLQNETKYHSFEKGEVIIQKGQKIGGVYLVKSGLLRVYSMDSNGNEKPIYSLNKGEMCVFSINCVLKKVVRDYVLDSMSQHIFNLMLSIEETAIYDISHQEIATGLGTAREVVSRHLKQLERLVGYVKLSRMKIQINSPQKLAELPASIAM